MDPGQPPPLPEPPTANPAVSTVKTMCIQTGMAMYTARKVIAGKHVRTDPGKKVMCL
jgi:hypothetical protein